MDKPLPNNVEVEIALLASIFLKNAILLDTIGIIKPDDFYFKVNSVIYTKLVELYKKNIPIDLITFANYVNNEVLHTIGGITYLSKMITSVPTILNYKEHIKIIKNLSNKRKIIEGCQEAIEEALKEEVEIKKIIYELQEKLPTADEFQRNKTVDTYELMEHTVNLIEEGYRNGGKITGITTGYPQMDKATNGFLKEDLFIIAARPSMGKTALIINMVNRLPKKNKALIFEMEMSKEKLGIRMLASQTLLNSKLLSRGLINESHFELITRRAAEIAFKENVFINCKAGLSISEIKAEAKKVKLQNKLDIIVIDHIGKIRPNNSKATRNDQLGQITEGLKNIAKDLNVCVIALSQLNRAVEQRVDKRPMLSDLRDSGNIEQDADVILLLYRDDYYAERENRISKNPGLLEAMVAKNRDGEAGLIKLNYNTEYQTIT